MSIHLQRDESVSGPVVTAIRDGGFRTQDHLFPDGVILTPQRAEGWTGSPDPAAIDHDSIDAVLAQFGDVSPEFILLGTGEAQVFPPAALRRSVEERDIGIEVMDSRAAARAWAILRAEDRQIAALLLPLR